MECFVGPATLKDSCPASNTSPACGLLMLLMQTILTKKCELPTRSKYPKSYTKNLKENDCFDFIVIGAGSAGSVVASRLSENPQWKVLLIEAGDYASFTSDMPSMYANLLQTEEDWNYLPEKDARLGSELQDGIVRWPRGKMVGGSSAMNAMNYVRGNSKDYDTWSNLLQDKTWNYKSIEKYFQKIENAYKAIDLNQIYYGRSGQLPLLQNPLTEINKKIIESGLELGLKYYPNEVQKGYFQAFNNIKEGIRQSASKAYIADLKEKRKNLFLATKVLATKLIFDKKTKKCIGVELKIGTKQINVYANKEVIVSAGAINSPQLLMLSGLGPSSHLNSLKIPLIKDLKGVGRNLQDHAMLTNLFIKLKNGLAINPDSETSETSELNLIDDIYQYFVHNGEGALGNLGTLMAMINPSTNLTENVNPTLQILHLHVQKNFPFFTNMLKSFSLGENIVKTALDANKNYSFIYPLIVLLNPKSKGRILLRSNNFLDKPIIIPNYFSDEGEQDLNTFLGGVKFILDFIRTKTFSKLNDGLLDIDYKNCKNCGGLNEGSDDWWKCAIKASANTLYHPVGTCKMGVEEDEEAVVDSQLRVRGIENLRVVDASIMPKIVSANTNAATMMIGEKGADLIKETHV